MEINRPFEGGYNERCEALPSYWTEGASVASLRSSWTERVAGLL